jgi:hypothetical protein
MSTGVREHVHHSALNTARACPPPALVQLERLEMLAG